MELSLGSRFKLAWNIFMNKDPTKNVFDYYGSGSSYRPDRVRLTRGNERSIITSIFNRIAIDSASVEIKHVKLDKEGRFLEEMDSDLNECLSTEANLDQTGQSLIQDIVMSMLDEGCVAIVPVITNDDPEDGMPGSFDVENMRVGKVVEWFPQDVKVEVYNEWTGKREQVKVSKRTVCIIENPLFAVINEPNSTMQRLMRKLSLLDVVDEQSSAGKLDLIIQLPYIIKTPARREQAENRRKDIEKQLAGSKYGIAYTDGTERITQLNRPVENNLLTQVEYLTNLLFSQLGITQEILNGTADEKAMLNYYTRTIVPILSAITGEMKRKFLTKTARTQGQSIMFFRDPFRLIPVTELAEIADKLTRAEAITSNEIRQKFLAMKPVMNEPRADQLVNSNNITDADQNVEGEEDEDIEARLAELDEVDADLDELEDELNHSDDDQNELLHYASPYYDPVKAHEYYMRTRELKGRKSTSKLNDEGKNAAKYVRERLTEEKKGLIKTHKDTTDSMINEKRNSKNSSTKSYRERINSEISHLRDKLKGMSREEKENRRGEIESEIARLRENNKSERQRLMEEYKGYSKTMREGHKEYKKNLNEQYDEKYIAELDKMRDDARFKKVSKVRGRKKTTKSK